MKQITKLNSKYISSFLFGSVLVGSLGHAAVVFQPSQEPGSYSEVQGKKERLLRKLYDAGIKNYNRHLTMDESAIREEFKSNSREAVSKSKLRASVSSNELAHTQIRFENDLDRANKNELLEKEAKVLRYVYSQLPGTKNPTVTSAGDLTSLWFGELANVDPNPLAAVFMIGLLPLAIVGDAISAVIYILSFGQYG